MSWLFSRALVEVCLRHTLSDGERFAALSWIPTAEAYSLDDKTKDGLIPSRYGMTCEPLTVSPGFHPLMSSLEVFLAKPSATRQQAKILPMIFGRKCSESWQMSLPGTSMPRTYRQKQSTLLQTTCDLWVTKPKQYPFQRKTWVLTTIGLDAGYLHTPTTQGNYCADSMQKWPSCRVWRRVFGKVTPQAQEWLMGWPIGWTGLEPLEMDKCRSYGLRLLPRSVSECHSSESAC